MNNRFDQQVIVITGGSTGIGFAIARAAIAEGAKRVYITGRSAQTLASAAAELGEKAIAVVSDVSRSSDLATLDAEIGKRDDSLDVVFANAGIAATNQLGDTCEAQYDEIFDINVKGVLLTVQTLLPRMVDGAAVVLTSSIVSGKGMENLSLYSASKAAVRSFARTWANDLKSRQIRVNALSPGFTRTPIMKNGLKWDEEQIAAFDEQARTLVPLGHVATPESIASAALFLASRDAEYVNGIELAVDGGFSQV
ncbi:SDR family NAD(P)-dependent oxidoreductase [Granulosicoccus sp. 3-233]|uniref:SDR family NAD(P)-dependent oxidoreductase n=1 Tax=Granulosicoccus sp. 3-233 TaxID=3417969 RepID=UPI003D333DA9